METDTENLIENPSSAQAQPASAEQLQVLQAIQAHRHRVITFINEDSSNIDYTQYDEVRFVSYTEPTRFPQYLAAISATFSAMAAGIILGWTSPIKSALEDGAYNGISVDDNQMGWIGSFTTVGAMLTCIPTGILCEKIGCRQILLFLVIPFGMGWLLILFATNLTMLYIGRFILGIAAGACCVAAPMYCSEIADTEIRGILGSFFQLMVTVGVLYAYVVGAFLSPIHHSAVCALQLFLFALTFLCQPQTPHFYSARNDTDGYNSCLERLNASPQSHEILSDETSFLESITALRRPECRKALCISLGLMVFQQFSGVNAIIFYTSEVFVDAGVKLSPQYCSIIVAVFQVIATFGSSLIVDRVGRRRLLIISALLMALSMIGLGTYFIIKSRYPDIAHGWLISPIILVIVFIMSFSFGYGPIPWVINSEIFANDVKCVASSVAGTCNWLLAFIITKFYLQLEKKFGDADMYFFFGVCLLGAALFAIFFVPETKGRTTLEIQTQLQEGLLQ